MPLIDLELIMFGLVKSGKIILPYFMADAPPTDPAATFNK
jgi:hypothetical protein